MKKLLILLFVGIFLMEFILAEQMYAGGGGMIKIEDCRQLNFCPEDSPCNPTGRCELNMSSPTGCLVSNCDYFCKQYKMDYGKYYEPNKCWCEKYLFSEHGRIVKDDGWIEVKECINNKDYSLSVKSSYSLIELIEILLMLLVGLVIIWLGILIYKAIIWKSK